MSRSGRRLRLPSARKHKRRRRSWPTRSAPSRRRSRPPATGSSRSPPDADPAVPRRRPARRDRRVAGPGAAGRRHPVLLPARHGAGLATEAATAVRDHARTVLRAPRLIAIIDPRNVASQRVATKIGLALEKRSAKNQLIYSARLLRATLSTGLSGDGADHVTVPRVGRTVTLVLVDAEGVVLGALPPFDVEVPWWPEVSDIVAAVRERHGIDVTVLRLLHADRPAQPGGHVTYAAQVFHPVPVAVELSPAVPVGVERSPAAPVGLQPSPAVPVRLQPSYGVTVGGGPEPRRAPWAVPGGPAASVAWALKELGRDDAVAVQQRTWNLSAIWRLDAGGETVAWLKQVPVFFAHEAPLLRLLSTAVPGLTPALLAAGDAGRMLLAHVPGEDRYEAGASFCAEVARDFHPLQEHYLTRVPELLAAGVPDNRFELDRIARAAAPWLDTIDGLAGLMDELPARLAAIEACGLPDTLVHGDLHPGNVRESAAGRVIVDWGDASVAHPAYDILRLTGDLPEPDAAALLEEWAARWRRSVPGCDPGTAVALIRPVAALRAAAVYQNFLDHIEHSERPYHESDVPERLTAAVAAAQLT
ncbi:GNAT family N-acetyltransferase [Actinoplanes sp. NPDC049316]|uniref:GNAT family N-acetyltransferase n=1 Tax=Actinoplanes sp. NPDC049316 TaxID=3154727 RepID=UPI00343DE1BD